jgi:hypothetical protein
VNKRRFGKRNLGGSRRDIAAFVGDIYPLGPQVRNR